MILWIASYPKSGNTWLRALISSYYYSKDGVFNESLIKNDVRSKTQGRSEILVNGELFVEETNYGRTLFFDADGSLKWFHLNKADNGKTYFVSWSRILYDKEDIKIVNNFLESRGKCND